MPAELRTTQISVGEDDLAEMRRRLRAARFAPAVHEAEDWRYGVPAEYLADLVGYWASDFDWRAQERRMNAHEHLLLEIDGGVLHALRERGSGSHPAPVVLTHGWPWTFWDYEAVIDPLAHPERYGGDPEDGFDVIVPSLPGYGFSTPLRRAGVTPGVTADLWVELMRALGYGQFYAHGADWGQRVAIELGRRHADATLGIHLANAPLSGLASARPWADAFSTIYERSAAPVEDLVAWERTRASHVAVHGLDPQTLAHAMHDSPSGLLAWLLERRRAWSDCGGDVEAVFSRDQILTAATIYWATDSFASAARMYWEVMNAGPPSRPPGPVLVPTYISTFTSDIPPGYQWDGLETMFSDLREVTAYDRGGHFAAAERPDVVIDSVRRLRREVEPEAKST